MSRQQNKQQKQRDAAEGTVAPTAAAALERTQIAKYHTKGGHGFAAEDANNLADRLRGRNAEVVGKANELNGADRLVDGVLVQSKYCKTASDTMRSAFDGHGNYRYAGQVLEVPKDQYDECVKQMRQSIPKGKVPGHTDPSDAKKLVMKGAVTYKQARNIARAGNIDSVRFDIQTGAVAFAGTFGLSFIINYAQGRWQATKEAFASGSAAWVTQVVSAQLLRTKAAAVGTVAVRPAVRAAARTSLGKKAIERIATASLRKAAHGAAAINHVSKLLRSNAVTASVAVAVSCVPDLYRAAFKRSISWQQFTKNAGVQVVGVGVGGVAGWMGCVGLGSAIPVVGPVIGVIGALVVGTAASHAAKGIADKIVEDDVKAMARTLEAELLRLRAKYKLSKREFKEVMEIVHDEVDQDWWHEMYSQTRGDAASGRKFVRRKFKHDFKEIVDRRYTTRVRKCLFRWISFLGQLNPFSVRAGVRTYAKAFRKAAKRPRSLLRRHWRSAANRRGSKTRNLARTDFGRIRIFNALRHRWRAS